MTAAAIYARISDDAAGTGLGVERQLQDCRKLIEARGWTIAAEYVDNDISAYSGKPRPEYLRLLDDVRAGQLKVIVAWHPDRLHRSPRELEDFIDLLDKHGTAVTTVQAGVYDLSTPTGRMHARVVGAMARYESDQKAARQRRKHEELAMAGKIGGGGTRPYGYETDRLTVRPDEARVIRELVRRVIAGESIRGLVIELNERKVPSVNAKPWTPMVLRRLLLSARISGQREYQPVVMRENNEGKLVRVRKLPGDILGKAEWPAIITPAETAQLRAILTDPGRVTLRAPRRYVLTHLLRCHGCNGRLVARPRADKERRYVCPGRLAGTCGKTFVLAEPVEELVSEMALIRLDSAEFEQALREHERSSERDAADAAVMQLQADRRRLEELAVMWADGELTRPEYLKARERLQTRVEAAERQAARRNGNAALRPLAGSARKRWAEMTFDQHRAVLQALLAEVTIGPGRRGFNRFDASRVQPVWKI